MTSTEHAARTIAFYCCVKGWCAKWADLSPDAREEFVGVAQTATELATRHVSMPQRKAQMEVGNA